MVVASVVVLDAGPFGLVTDVGLMGSRKWQCGSSQHGYKNR